ncbi:MAG: protein-S-isoprenylcysteine O-methyltransferase [Pseudomonadota bacterium]
MSEPQLPEAEQPSSNNKIGNIIGILLATALLLALIWRLPINGWGSLVWFAMMSGMAIIRIPHERNALSTATEDNRQDTVENILLALVALGSGVLPALQLATGLLSFASYTVPVWWPVLGVMLIVPGLWLFWRSHADLGRNWSVSLELRAEHGLVTQGVYARVRHPMYSAIFLLYGGQALCVHNWLAGLSGLAAFLAMYLIRTPIEEAMMRDRFGDAYEEYCRVSGRLLPKLARTTT